MNCWNFKVQTRNHRTTVVIDNLWLDQHSSQKPINSRGLMLKNILHKGSILQTENWRRSSEGLMGSQWKSMEFVSENTELLSQSHGWERWTFLWNAELAKGGKHGSNSPSPTAATIPAGTAIPQPGETHWEPGNSMLGYSSAALESRRGAAARTQGAVGARKPRWWPLSWMCSTSQEGRTAKKSYRLRSLMHQGWHLIYTYPQGKAEYDPAMLLHCMQQVSDLVRNQEVFPPNHVPAHLGKSRSLTPRKHHGTTNSKMCHYLSEVTQEIHRRTGISQACYLKCSCDIPSTLSMSDK